MNSNKPIILSQFSQMFFKEGKVSEDNKENQNDKNFESFINRIKQIEVIKKDLNYISTGDQFIQTIGLLNLNQKETQFLSQMINNLKLMQEYLNQNQEKINKNSLFYNIQSINSNENLMKSPEYFNSSEKSKPLQTKEKNIHCKCSKTNCLKLYCECFLNGEICGVKCICTLCENSDKHKETREKAISQILERNPQAFLSKTVKKSVNEKGCNCQKSKCLKKYCECYNLGLKCSEKCRCTTCSNMDESNNETEFSESEKLTKKIKQE